MKYKINSSAAQCSLLIVLTMFPIAHADEQLEIQSIQSTETSVKSDKPVIYRGDMTKLETNFVMNLQKIDKKLFCVSQNNFFEARGESLMGKIAVAEVVRNRSELSNYPNDVCSVVQQTAAVGNTRVCQFSWFCRGSGKIPLLKGNGEVNHAVYRQWHDSILAALKVRDNSSSDVTQGATHFYAHKNVNPQWNKNLVKVKVIGNHTFMAPREPRAK